MRPRFLRLKNDKTYHFRFIERPFLFYSHEFYIYGRKHIYRGCAKKATNQQCPICLRKESTLTNMFAANCLDMDKNKSYILEGEICLFLHIKNLIKGYSESILNEMEIEIITKKHGDHTRYQAKFSKINKTKFEQPWDLTKIYSDKTTYEDIISYLNRLYGHFDKRRKERQRLGRWGALEIR